MNTSDDAAYCRRKAEECREKAKAAADEQERQQWLELASLWLSCIQSENGN